MYGRKLTRRVALTTPPKVSDRGRKDNTIPITPNDNIDVILLGLASAVTGISSKTMTSTEREHKCEAKENQAFYEILFASIVEATNIQVWKANKTAKQQNFINQQSKQSPPE
jgi:hypothetical protein